MLSGVPSPETPEGREALTSVVKALCARPEVTGTLSYLDQQDSYFAGESARGSFMVAGLAADAGRTDRVLPGLRAATTVLEGRLRARHPQARLRWSGEAAINLDLWRSSTDDVHAAERRTLPVTLAILLAVFGSVVAAALPVATGALAVGLAMGLVSLAAKAWPLSVLAVNVASMLGLALGIDYALLSVSRFREARQAGAEPRAAAALTARLSEHLSLQPLIARLVKGRVLRVEFLNK